MKNSIVILITTLIVGGCASTKVEKEYSDLSVTQNEIQSSKWSQLNRFPPRYPKQAAIKSIEGCATVEYVITPQNEVKDITVIASTSKQFSKAAVNVIKNWKWSELPKNILTQPVKTQTRFDFCFDKPNQPCSTITPNYSCPSDDIIYSTGMRVKVSG
ncbi:energy transducer TonB [Aliiglaciecola sp. 2_MG-2023]|uniref:energy transducer TonB n=1 Tax=unclassified Aliiglaciecola TaxID=2593648 RepID=UPI0026E2561D|nr:MULTISPECIES: energy transducer TonB [unclassified Aliiglaciecola]MDO6712784.1 energy transducer TonB [Aliiglaciecola sp. 2_MG-2023]MDO6753817.1 energy transducer TonB [Aliiglaciecola sp. 1_MG-2023]